MDVLFFIALISCTCTHALNYNSVIEDTTLTITGAMSLTVVLSDLDDSVTISMTGPTSVYYAVGIGSCEMSNSWALVVPGLESPPFEQLLGSHSAGSLLDSTFNIEADTTSDLLRTVTFSRALSQSVNDGYYAFSTSENELSVMWAYGTQAEYSNHGSSQRGCTTLPYATTVHSNTQSASNSMVLTDKSSTDSLYFFGHSTISLFFVVSLLGMILSYALFRGYSKYYKTKSKMMNTPMDETQALLIDDNSVQKYVAI